ncbi:MAG: DNA polymerase III subunit gamma/tau C-terminal domain-containing protein, partial [Sedimenticolaceae bacterium]
RPRKAVEGASPLPNAQAAVAKTEGVPPGSAGQGDTDFSDWHGFVRRLGLKGMAAQLAENCVFDAWDGRQLSLRLDPVCSGLIGSLAERRLQEAVTATAGQPVVLHLAVEASADETPAQREAREQRVRQEATEADISADPLVLGVQEAFDAEIVPDSIRRID